MNIQNVPIESITPYPGNPRINASAIATVATSLKAFGWRQPIVVDKDRVIIVGHTRWKAAHSLGMTEVPIHIADNLTPEQAKAYRIMDNKSGEAAEWDFELLKLEMQDLQAVDFPLADTGFALSEIQEIMADEIKGDEDDVPPVPEDPKVRLGELYLLGNHRLLCGDSTKREDVERLMAGQKADMVFTDPPYGVDYDGGGTFAPDGKTWIPQNHPKLAGDTTTELYGPCCAMAALFSDPKAALYLWHAGVKGIAAAAAAAAAGYEIRCEIIWNKNNAQWGALSAQYKQKHEPAYYCFKKGKSPHWFGPKNEVTVWDIARANANEYHPTQKPVALAERALSNSSVAPMIVLDLFGGSGSTLIAAEKMGRQAYLMELAPSYGDVILERYLAATGKMPTLEDGTPWDRVKASRTAQPDVKPDIES